MKPSNPIVKYSVGLIYALIFFSVSSAITVCLSVIVTLLNENGINLGKIGQFLPLIFGLLLYAYSCWLAKEASIAFSENSCYFFEAIIISIKKSKMYLYFLPIVGKYFDSEMEKEATPNDVKTIDCQTRFDKE